MPLTINDPETQKLAETLALRQGLTPQQAVREALSQQLGRATRAAKQARQEKLSALLAIANRCAALPEIDYRSPDQILYNADGLPQ
jgi:antitoxin VapB